MHPKAWALFHPSARNPTGENLLMLVTNFFLLGWGRRFFQRKFFEEATAVYIHIIVQCQSPPSREQLWQGWWTKLLVMPRAEPSCLYCRDLAGFRLSGHCFNKKSCPNKHKSLEATLVRNFVSPTDLRVEVWSYLQAFPKKMYNSNKFYCFQYLQPTPTA